MLVITFSYFSQCNSRMSRVVNKFEIHSWLCHINWTINLNVSNQIRLHTSIYTLCSKSDPNKSQIWAKGTATCDCGKLLVSHWCHIWINCQSLNDSRSTSKEVNLLANIQFKAMFIKNTQAMTRVSMGSCNWVQQISRTLIFYSKHCVN